MIITTYSTFVLSLLSYAAHVHVAVAALFGRHVA